jgi:DNA-binding MarR family transcriptional regulator
VDGEISRQQAGQDPQQDALDQVVNDLRRWRPDLEVVGLPITGRVLRLAQFLSNGREQVLAGFGLTVADFDVLATLRRRAGTDAVNVRELQHAMMLSSSGVTKRLDRLETSALIERHPDPGDRRGVLIKLSPSGLDLIERAVPAITIHESELVAGAISTADERTRLERSLRQLLVAQENA